MGVIDTSSPRAKFGIFLILLAAPFVIVANAIKWVGVRLGIIKEKHPGLTPEQIATEDLLRKEREK